VVTLVGDGSFLFGQPTAALWAAHVYRAPFLCVIFNNERYHAPKRALQNVYGANCYSVRTGLWVGIDIVPPPDYSLIAQASYAFGQKVTDPAAVKPALEQALAQVRHGRCAVLDIKIE